MIDLNQNTTWTVHFDLGVCIISSEKHHVDCTQKYYFSHKNTVKTGSTFDRFLSIFKPAQTLKYALPSLNSGVTLRSSGLDVVNMPLSIPADTICTAPTTELRDCCWCVAPNPSWDNLVALPSFAIWDDFKLAPLLPLLALSVDGRKGVTKAEEEPMAAPRRIACSIVEWAVVAPPRRRDSLWLCPLTMPVLLYLYRIGKKLGGCRFSWHGTVIHDLDFEAVPGADNWVNSGRDR